MVRQRTGSGWRPAWLALLGLLAVACAGHDPAATIGTLPAAGPTTLAATTPPTTGTTPLESPDGISTLVAAERATVTVGGFDSAESSVLAEIYAGALKRVGVTQEVRLRLGDRRAVGRALERGDIDVVLDRVGAALEYWSTGSARAGDGADATGALATLTAHLEPLGLVALTPSPAGLVAVVRGDKIGYSLKTVFDRVSRQLQSSDLAALTRRADQAGEDPEHLADEWLEGHGFGPEQDSAG